ncbi:MAG: glycosyltransferase family 2 protein [Phycisphaerae bacterium]|nr:glycosyltransferase family 2 protein [Phycisphaerae bacterium]
MVSKSITAFFPCHNEAGNIEALTAATVKTLEALTDDFEIIIVNDGSTDETAAIANKLSAVDERIEVIHHDKNKGYGSALQSGFAAASKDLIFYTDGDGQFDVSQLREILPLINEYDIITCYRVGRQDNFVRKFNAYAWCTLVNISFKLHLRDIDCAFKVYRREVIDAIEMHSTGALIDTEMLSRAKRKGFTMVQKPVKHLPRLYGQSSGGNIKVILRAFKELFKLRREIMATK